MARPTELQRVAMKPNRWVTFWRTFWPYQLVRFVIINVRMIRVVRRSHADHAAAPGLPEKSADLAALRE